MPRISLSITIDDAHLGQTEAIARAVRACGLEIQRIVPEAGAIQATGQAECDLDAVRRISGVQRVRRERSYQLPPMTGSIPQ